MERQILTGPTVRPLGHRERIDWHDHVVHQLIHPLHGVLRVSTGRGSWVVPPNRGVWIPATVPHAHQADGPTEMRSLIFEVGVFEEPTVLVVSALLREVIRALSDDHDAFGGRPGDVGDGSSGATRGGLSAGSRDGHSAAGRGSVSVAARDSLSVAARDSLSVAARDSLSVAFRDSRAALSTDHRHHLEQVALHEVRRARQLPLLLPAPADPRLVRLCELLADDPADQRSLRELGREVGAAERTLSRLFRAETGLTFPQWRGQLRLHHAVRLLAAGHSVTRVAADCGFRSPSAFIEAFRALFGTTPGRYRAE
ncbi:helix-turn-helix transcriptional regulator [Actinoplanes oblitus]|uniref:Helix-turn-helix transcriptional regulator n=1 Tax=Actinoplanes oblitus TaxID=3040509 RepID=A0ABY8WUB6_9ACTN|nr:helix-turn-helix transcriptional regulator [Actinoplanes oblitus]WIM99450.1 helix-turn-helix transcriptional regulator [Actinoplanes oblitus]